MTAVKTPKKLIEVALPLDAINAAVAREKSIRHGHPSTLHLWWARRPLAAARAVIFAQMVNDPGGEHGYFSGMTKAQAKVKRDELFKIIEDLVLWENTNNEEVLGRARAVIWESWRETCELNKRHPQAAELFDPEKLPAFHDPFAGGGALPLEAQRLGLESYASDLNPVAVTINKAMIEILPRFAGRKPVGPLSPDEKQASLHEDWSGAKGLAEDVRRYIQLIAMSRCRLLIRSCFPVRRGRYVQPVIEGDGYRFEVRSGAWPAGAENGTKAGGRGANFHCLISRAPVSGSYIKAEVKAEGQARRLGARLMAIVAEGMRGRVYLAPTAEHEAIAREAKPTWRPDGEVPAKL